MDLTALNPAQPERGSAFTPWQTWRDEQGPAVLVAAAILAANARNVQPWTFRVAPDRIDLFADLTRRQGALDPLDRELNVGLGCALENMSLAARASGWSPEIHLRPDPDRPEHAATMLLHPGTPDVSELYLAIPARHTNRGPFRSEALSDELIAEISSLGAVDLPRAGIRWFTTAQERRRIGTALVAATEEIIQDEEQSRAGHAWFRGSDAEVRRHADGMTTATQGMHPLVARISGWLPAPSRRMADRFWLRQTRKVHVPTAAAFAIVTVPDAGDVVDRITGGRLLQRIHLFATSRGLAVGHLNMLTVRADRERQTGAPPQFGRILADLVGDPAAQALVTFRIGYPTRPAAASPRRPVAAVLR
ncbi:hypothetical protein JNW91_12320 [Micromonospora sp. STR1_7]|uniref:Nitroreductase n=1 Tax=Micromonospora parastrephiae TaxID=2806101 RepID=A0ABS1XTM9_9ACTN|nr:hypothetical protein [Micromonospora parastrephiae]MBM0232578.1 hypothetical protein [Micromonospora parastrephiae]